MVQPVSCHYGELIPTPKLPDRIELAVRHLTHIQDYQLVIQLVDHWHTIGQPTPIAHLAAIRALMQLCQMDRAWARLREILEEHPKWLDAQLTAAELFLQRGWPKQARKPLEQALQLQPEHPRIFEIQKNMRTETKETTSLEGDPTAEDLIAHAKFLLSTGSSLKGRALLNQIRKTDPNNPIVSQLLWAIRGDYALNDRSLWGHYAEQDHPFENLSDFGEAPEQTESTSLPASPPNLDDETPNQFADLFLHQN